MKTIRIYGINEKMFYEKLPNGLDVYLFPMAKRNQTAVTLATRFGAKDTEFTPYNKKKMTKMPEGIAHFLEHRLCTDKNGQNAFDFYAKSGSEFNADTSACKTRFYFTCTKNLTLNLLFLLDMIQDPCFKTEDIEREKSIIEQEIKNDADKPYTNLYREGMRNVFCYHSVRNSILGTFDDIKGINKEMLENCYDTFYQPSNMFLVITGNFDISKVMKVLRKHQASKNLIPNHEIKLLKYKEPNKVNKKYDEIFYPVDCPKLQFKIKIPLNKLKAIKNYDLYLLTIFQIIFGNTSFFVECMKKQGYIAYNLGLHITRIDIHTIVTLSAEGNHLEEIIEEIKRKLKYLTITEDDLIRDRKINISEEIEVYDKVVNVRNYIEYMLFEYNKILNDEIRRFKSLNMRGLKEVMKMMDLSHISITLLQPKKIS